MYILLEMTKVLRIPLVEDVAPGHSYCGVHVRKAHKSCSSHRARSKPARYNDYVQNDDDSDEMEDTVQVNVATKSAKGAPEIAEDMEFRCAQSSIVVSIRLTVLLQCSQRCLRYGHPVRLLLYLIFST